MRPLVPLAPLVLLVSAIGSFAIDARAANETSVPASGGLGALTVTLDPVGHIVRFTGDKGQGELPITLDPTEIDSASVEVSKVGLGDGKRAVHVRVPSRARPGVAWEALLAGRETAVLWSGVTGFATGEEGERAGEAMDLPREDGGFVVLGEVREDLRICGQPRTLLTPRVLDPRSMTFRGATMQRLAEDKRDDAEEVTASAHGNAPEPPLARLLQATGASTAIGAPAAMTDGDPATAWSEGRPGDGHGEFVTLRAPADVRIARLAIVPAPATLPAHGAAPHTLYLVTDARTILVTLPEDAWTHAGAAYDIPLTEPLHTSCLSVVLDKAWPRPGEPHPEVTIAELTAYSDLDHPGATLADVAHALAGGGARADGAKAILERAGDAGLAAASAAYSSLDASGRALAIDAAIGAGSCEAGAPLLLSAMGDRDAEVARKASEKVERCGKRATAALLQGLRGSDSKVRANAARLIASVAPGEAIDALVGALGAGDPTTRDAVRAALAKASRGANDARIAALVSDGARPPATRVELLRALQDRLPGSAPSADVAIGALSDKASFETRYLLLGPLSALARAGDAQATTRLGAIIAADPDANVRARAAESAAAIAGVREALLHAVDDPSPRVREAALHALVGVTNPAPAVEPIAKRLASDEWTFVRAAAAATLASLPTDPLADTALTRALDDRSPTVRAEVVGALAARGVHRAAKAIRERMVDPHEALEPRIAAVRAAVALCDRDALDPLTTVARQSTLPLATDLDLVLAFEAVNALGSLHPTDLASRLAPLNARDASAELRASVARALASAPTCR